MSVRFVLVVLLLTGTTVPISVSAQHLPAFLRVRASDALDAPATSSGPVDSTEEAWSRQQVRGAQLMAWGAGIGASLIPYAAVARAMERRCYDAENYPQRFVTKFALYGVLGSTGVVLAALGLARLRGLPDGFSAAHPLSHKQRVRAGVMSVVAMASSLAFMSGLTFGEMEVCGSS